MSAASQWRHRPRLAAGPCPDRCRTPPAGECSHAWVGRPGKTFSNSEAGEPRIAPPARRESIWYRATAACPQHRPAVLRETRRQMPANATGFPPRGAAPDQAAGPVQVDGDGDASAADSCPLCTGGAGDGDGVARQPGGEVPGRGRHSSPLASETIARRPPVLPPPAPHPEPPPPSPCRSRSPVARLPHPADEPKAYGKAGSRSVKPSGTRSITAASDGQRTQQRRAGGGAASTLGGTGQQPARRTLPEVATACAARHTPP